MIKILKHLSWKQWLLIIVSFILVIAQVYLELEIPDYMTEITTILTDKGEINEILKSGGKMLICALLSGLLAVSVCFFSAIIGAKLAQKLRSEIYSTVSSFSSVEMHRFHISSLITRSTNDIAQIQQTISMGLQVVIKAPVMAIWVICKIVSKNYEWSIATAVTVAIMLIGIIVIISLCVPKFKIVQKQTDELNNAVTENLTGARVIKAFNAEGYVEEKFNQTNENLTKTNLFTGYALSMLNPMMNLLMNGLSLSIYVIGAYVINKASTIQQKKVLFSDMIVFFSYAMQIIASFIMLVVLFMILPRAQVSAKRIQEVLDTKSSISDGKGVQRKEKGTIKFENVTFGYEDAKEPVLKNINFEVNKGESCAIIGATGSGKSTLIKLIPRLYDVSEGAIYVDGENVKDYKLSELHDIIGYISQKAVLFSGTVESNIIMGEKEEKPISADLVDNAIDMSQSSGFVNEMKKGSQSVINQGGTNISGGQKQRLSIARAIARNPEILIFDDSFSALDYQTDKELRKTLKEKLKDTTNIIVAQRIGTIKDCDKIIVIDNGEIVGIGTHRDLLNTCKEYKEIALSQLTKEELEYDAK